MHLVRLVNIKYFHLISIRAVITSAIQSAFVLIVNVSWGINFVCYETGEFKTWRGFQSKPTFPFLYQSTIEERAMRSSQKGG